MREFFCLDCGTTVELTRHGRCGTCGSDAVDIASREKPVGVDAVGTLERMWRMSGGGGGGVVGGGDHHLSLDRRDGEAYNGRLSAGRQTRERTRERE